MRNKMIKLVGVFAVGLWLVASTTQGCGGSSSGAPSASDIATLCNKSCMTAVKCAMGFLTMDACVSACEMGAMGANGATCSNEAAIYSAAQKCANMTDCTALEMCSATIPKCETGSAGTSGTGAAGHAGASGVGTSGTNGGAGTTGGAGGMTGTGGVLGGGGVFGGAGTAGSTCATACTKADACCKALPGAMPANCTFKADCDAAGASGVDTAVMDCNIVLQSAALLGAMEPAACK